MLASFTRTDIGMCRFQICELFRLIEWAFLPQNLFLLRRHIRKPIQRESQSHGRVSRYEEKLVSGEIPKAAGPGLLAMVPLEGKHIPYGFSHALAQEGSSSFSRAYLLRAHVGDLRSRAGFQTLEVKASSKAGFTFLEETPRE